MFVQINTLPGEREKLVSRLLMQGHITLEEAELLGRPSRPFSLVEKSEAGFPNHYNEQTRTFPPTFNSPWNP